MSERGRRRSKHQTRIDLRDLTKGVPGGGIGGGPGGFGVFKRLAGVISPINEGDAMQAGVVTLDQLYWTDLIRNAAAGLEDGIGGILLAARVDTVNLNGALNNVDLGAGVVHKIVPDAAGRTISGFVAGTGQTGRVRLLLNDGAYGFSLLHQGSGSSSANRIVCPYGQNLYVPPGTVQDYSHGVLLYYLGEPTPLPLRWAAFPLGDSPNVRYARLASDPTRDQTSLADITGLGLPMEANTCYSFLWELMWSANDNAASGMSLAVNGPASPTNIGYVVRIADTAGAGGWREEQANAYDTVIQSRGVGGAGSMNWATIRGICRNGANAGTLMPRFAAEVLNDEIQVWNGSWGKLVRTEGRVGL